MVETERFEKVEVASHQGLRAWLAAHHAQRESVWLVRFKKSVPEKYVDRLTLLDELLCFGWIDGLARKLDAQRTMQLISPRKQQAWAQSYKERAARLKAEGRMQAPGLAAIARSKRLGLWNATAAIDALEEPRDLRAALQRHRAAARHFDAAAPSYRRNVLRWIALAKKAPTRAKRIATVVEHAKRGDKVPNL